MTREKGLYHNEDWAKLASYCLNIEPENVESQARWVARGSAELLHQAFTTLLAAAEHLDCCSYGTEYERLHAEEKGLPARIIETLKTLAALDLKGTEE